MSTRKETVTTTEEKDMKYCDGCGKLIASNHREIIPYNHCGECDRDFCKACYGDQRTQVHEEVYMIPCKSCREVLTKSPKYINRLIGISKEEESLREERWAIDKKIKRASRKLHPSVYPVGSE